MIITSKDNEIIKETTKLMSSSKHRKQQGCFVAEGVRLCTDGVSSGAKLLTFLFTGSAAEKYPDEFRVLSDNADRCCEISPSLLGKISDTRSPQGFVCIFKTLDKNHKMFKINNQGRYAALENIQDPSNMGTILRSAEALGVDGIIRSPDCCDVYSPKVVRGSMGAVFRVPVFVTDDFTDYISALTAQGIRTYASTPHDAENIEDVDFSQGGVMLIGNEGNGLKNETIAVCSTRVRINMKGRAESLNASAAAAILLYKLQG